MRAKINARKAIFSNELNDLLINKNQNTKIIDETIKLEVSKIFSLPKIIKKLDQKSEDRNTKIAKK